MLLASKASFVISVLVEAGADGWGNGCYVLVSEFGKNYLYGKMSGKTVNHLEQHCTFESNER